MPDRKLDLTSHTFISQRLRQHYVDWGNPDAPPLILVHGGRDHCRSWDWVADRLRDDYHIVAPDLRGHGDSQWSPDGNYSLAALVYDLAQLVHRQRLAPARIVAHSMGAMIALRYAGLYPENVSALVAIEGIGGSPGQVAQWLARPVEERLRDWIDRQRELSGRHPRRYASIDEALVRMRKENERLTPAQARHLTMHGISQNEDGSYSWKFDNYVRSISPIQPSDEDIERLHGRIACPTLLVHGSESWASNPAEDGTVGHFRDARVSSYEGAGHWVHHDRLDAFVDEVRAFLRT